MPALLKPAPSNRHGRRDHDDKDALDSVYGDLHITAPLGFPSTNTDLYVKDIGYEPDDEDYEFHSSRQASGRTEYLLGTGKCNPSGRSECDAGPTYVPASHVSERSRQRSRSQSGITRKREIHTEHRMRSSSSTRAAMDRQDFRRGNLEREHFLEQMGNHRLNGYLSAEEVSHGAVIDQAPMSMTKERSKTPQHHGDPRHAVSLNQHNQLKALHQSQITETASFERSQSPAVTILSPVSETFGPEEVVERRMDERAIVAPVQPPSRLLRDRTELVTSPGSLSDDTSSLPSRNLSPHTTLLSLRHGEQFINPLAAHSTLQPRSRTPQEPAITYQTLSINENPALSAIVNKPLPACPIGSSRSPPLECTAFMRSSGRTGPGLGATAIMRPPSRNQHSQTHPQPHPQQKNRQHRPQGRSASLSHIVHSPSQPMVGLRPSNSQSKPYPEDSERVPHRGDLPSAGSGFASDSHSTMSDSSVATPQDSPDQNRLRNMTTSPKDGLSSVRKLSDGHRSNSPNLPLRNHTPAPVNTSSSGGNIYNELRDDLAFVARDLNEMTLASHQERDTKPAKLRVRARSSSRQGRKLERQNNKELNGNNYIYREMDKSELMGGWGNTVFVPAYDLPNTRSLGRDHHDTNGEAEVLAASKKKNVHAVPDYEDLWG